MKKRVKKTKTGVGRGEKPTKKRVPQASDSGFSHHEHSPHPVLCLNSAGVLIYANQASKALLGDWDLRVGEKVPPACPLFVSGLAGLAKKREKEAIAGSRVYSLAYVPLKKTHEIHVYVRDITRQKDLENLQDAFLSSLAHELRTPITIVQGAIENIRDELTGMANGEQKKILDIAQNNLFRIRHIVNAILDTIRLQSRRSRMHLTEANVLDVLDSVCQNAVSMAENRGLEFERKWPQILPKVYADPGYISQALDNILKNALIHARSKVTVSADMCEEGTCQYVCVAVTNDGEGLSPREQQAVFDKYVQINRQHSGGYQGVGMGLYLCKKIVHQHQGRIWVESQKNGLTTFSFTLPVCTLKNMVKSMVESHIRLAEDTHAPFAVIRYRFHPEGVSAMMSRGKELLRTLKKLCQQNLRGSSDTLVMNDDEIFVVATCDKKGAVMIEERLQRVMLEECRKSRFLPSGMEAKLALYPHDGTNFESLWDAVHRKVLLSSEFKRQKIILVIEDDPNYAQLLEDTLKSDSYQIWKTAHGKEGIKLAQEKKPDLIIVDVRLPDISGFEVTGILSRHPVTMKIPIIVASAAPVDYEHRQFLEHGMIPLVDKSLLHDIAQWKSLVEEILWMHHEKPGEQAAIGS